MSQFPKAILFDLDDTLVNTSDTIAEAWRAISRQFSDGLKDVTSGEFLSALRDVRLALQEGDEVLPKGDGATETAWKAIQRLGKDDRGVAEQVGSAFRRERARLTIAFPGVREALQKVKDSDVKTALLTIGTRQDREKLLAREGLLEFFDCILTQDDLGFGKPDERIYRLALEELGVEPHETWMVGDSLEYDVEAPQKIGITGIWVVWPASKFANMRDLPKEHLPQFIEVRPDRIICHVRELVESSDVR